MTKVAIKANALGAGSIELVAPNTALVRTLDLPDRSGRAHLDGPAFYAYQTLAQSIGGADTVLALANKEFDTDGAFDTATYRFQPQVAGYYALQGNAQISGTTGGFYCVIYKNGSPHRYGTYINVSSSSPITTVSDLVYLNGTTDYVDLRASSGTTLNTSPGQQRVAFSGHLVRAA